MAIPPPPGISTWQTDGTIPCRKTHAFPAAIQALPDSQPGAFLYPLNNLNLDQAFDEDGKQQFDASNSPALNLEQPGENGLVTEIREEVRQELGNIGQEAREEHSLINDGTCDLSDFNQEALFTAMDWLRIIGAFNIPIYIFYALKNVYRESSLKTFIKAFFLLVGNFICIGMVIAFGSLFATMAV
tara:strand:+ start:87 stop:644 length:558 start_codon:yes stop_codon:yes gene_type:complete